MTIFNWFKPKPPPPRVDEVFNLPTVTNKEKTMSVKMTGIWQRKEVEFPTIQAMESAKVFALLMQPYTIKNDPQARAEYLAVYGVDEAANLDALNLVQSSCEKYVKGGVWVPPAPKPVAQALGPDEEILHTIFGDKVVKKGTTVPAPTTAVMTLSHEEMESLVEETVLRCLKRVFPEKF